MPPGAVIVIDNDGRRDVTVWGGVMTEVASIRGIAGTVINGVCRDVSASLAHRYPLFSRGRFMRTGKDRVRLVSAGKQLVMSGVDIRPGAIVCADTDGVVAVPQAHAEHIAEAAERIEQVESQIVAAVRAGSTLRRARETFGYHDLQRRRAGPRRHAGPAMAIKEDDVPSGSERTSQQLNLRADGVGLSVATIGRDGELAPVVFLHGFGSTKEDYAGIALQPAFAGRPFLAYDAPGCGETSCEDLPEVIDTVPGQDRSDCAATRRESGASILSPRDRVQRPRILSPRTAGPRRK